MEIIRHPNISDFEQFVSRPKLDARQLQATVAAILEDVRLHGDKAVMAYEKKFDNVALSSLAVTEAEIDQAVCQLPDDLLNALKLAHHNIRTFHTSQQQASHILQPCAGVECWRKAIPIERVGLYIPGGTAPLFSTVLMLATPAVIAGCKEIVLCSPPDKDGRLHPAILAAAKLAGVRKIYKAGGVQAIAAMAYGTETIPKTYKIFGPGNQYVTAAKRQVSIDGVAIDMPAGPSELCVVADNTCVPSFVAADLLSQAEHGKDSQVILVTDSEKILNSVLAEVDEQIKALPRQEIAIQALQNSKAVLTTDLHEAIRLSNIYAPEHLIIASEKARELAEEVVNAGSVFLGNYACESAGDYASGTNHTLPTNGNARAYSGVCLGSFMKNITFQHITPEGIRSIGKAVEVMAENEQLHAHKNAMTLRIAAQSEAL